ncbi:MAG: bifunctional phosphopantothenoylcysteine decarboxylase/phosphopantothenate--cysteine ligase CoaBC [Polyangiaceae bacterium]
MSASQPPSEPTTPGSAPPSSPEIETGGPVSESLPESIAREPVVRRRLVGKRITLCVTGSIAAYKAVLLLRLLMKEGADVEVVQTHSSREFVGNATFAGLSGKAVHMDMFAPHLAGELHVELAARSDLLLVVPASADVIARLAGGRADDLLTALALCATCPLILAPAMHPHMWMHPRTQANVRTLSQDTRVGWAGPVLGEVASGDQGVGRMAEPEAILALVIARLTQPTLGRRHVVISAGPTAEDVDPVRTLSNRSSGKMGFAIAERAALHGARVTLITGPVALPTPAGVTRIDVRSAIAMRSALWLALHPDLSGADALIMAAAVADYRPAQTHASKLKRSSGPLTLELLPNPDLLAEIGEARRHKLPVLVGFALETDTDERVVARAREKLVKKRVDLVVANRAEESLGLDHVRATLVSARDAEALASMPKEDAADRILDWVVKRLEEPLR